FGIDVVIVRVLFAVACLASGAGAIVYVLGWLVIPGEVVGGAGSAALAGADGGDGTAAPGSVSIARAALGDRRGMALCLAYVPVLIIVLLLGSALGVSWIWSITWPTFLCVAGLTLIWRNGPAEDRATLTRAVRPVLSVGDARGRSWAQVALWAVVGAGLLFAGLELLLRHRAPAAALWPIGGVVLVLAGVIVVFGPWWLRVARDLVVERQARARAEERADMAARVHDSVLQTLALIQRRADEPADVLRLARAQERELRTWLFEGQAPGGGETTTLAAGVKGIQDEVEADHGIKVEAVTVGDCELDEGLRTLLAAGKEATVNAAKWSKAPSVSLFVELRDQAVLLFVRDRGVGFNPEKVSPDRRGLSESIRGRMGRAGGSAVIRSSPGEGTEVILELPRPGPGDGSPPYRRSGASGRSRPSGG
ncbi:MAG: ATP-binding protein, partial [Acidimicrobiales bacterium]